MSRRPREVHYVCVFMPEDVEPDYVASLPKSRMGGASWVEGFGYDLTPLVIVEIFLSRGDKNKAEKLAWRALRRVLPPSENLEDWTLVVCGRKSGGSPSGRGSEGGEGN